MGSANRRRAGIDIDGVLYKWEPTARFLLRHYKDYDLEPSRSWDWIKDNVDAGTWNWLWTVGIQKGLFRHGNCYKGAFEALNQLAKTHDLVLITKRPKEALTDTLDWISFNRIPAREIHVIGTDRSKADIQVCDWYVDDNLEFTLMELAPLGKPVFLWDRPWNQKFFLPDNVERVSTWAELLWRVE